MAVESDDDLAVFFNPDEFGEPMTAVTALAGEIAFSGIPTTGYVGEDPGTTAVVSMKVPRIIAKLAETEGLHQGDVITMAGGKQVYVNDVHYKGALVIIHYHEHW